MERLLRATPKEDPDWIRIVDRMAATAFVMEYEAYRTCIDFEQVPPRDQRDLGYHYRTLRKVADDLTLARRTTSFACDALARHPSHRPHAPCDWALSPPAPKPAAVCAETNASFPTEHPPPGCAPAAP